MFGLIETGQGRVTLTQEGRDALGGSGKEHLARIAAFLKVELFQAMYERYKGNALPPPAAIERQMEQLGVSPKQKERARQTFTKSAQYASFIDAATGRFVKPGIAPKPDAPLPPKPEDESGNGGGCGLHPFIQGLLDELPGKGKSAGNLWGADKRKLWLTTAESIFKMIYKDEDGPKATEVNS